MEIYLISEVQPRNGNYKQLYPHTCSSVLCQNFFSSVLFDRFYTRSEGTERPDHVSCYGPLSPSAHEDPNFVTSPYHIILNTVVTTFADL